MLTVIVLAAVTALVAEAAAIAAFYGLGLALLRILARQ